MSERTEEFASATFPRDGLLVIVSDHQSLSMVKFETRRDDIVLSLEEAKKLARFILGEPKP